MSPKNLPAMFGLIVYLRAISSATILIYWTMQNLDSDTNDMLGAV